MPVSVTAVTQDTLLNADVQTVSDAAVMATCPVARSAAITHRRSRTSRTAA